MTKLCLVCIASLLLVATANAAEKARHSKGANLATTHMQVAPGDSGVLIAPTVTTRDNWDFFLNKPKDQNSGG